MGEILQRGVVGGVGEVTRCDRSSGRICILPALASEVARIREISTTPGRQQGIDSTRSLIAPAVARMNCGCAFCMGPRSVLRPEYGKILYRN